MKETDFYALIIFGGIFIVWVCVEIYYAIKAKNKKGGDSK